MYERCTMGCIEFAKAPAHARAMTKHSCSVWMMAFVVAVPATLAAGERRRNRAGEPVIVIVNDNAGTPRCVLREMRTTMDHLLSSSGISMEWVYRDAKKACVQPNPAPANAGIPQVLLSIVPDKPAYFPKNHPSLGLTVMGTNHTALHLAEIRKLAERLRLELGQLMALVAVHEVAVLRLERGSAWQGAATGTAEIGLAVDRVDQRAVLGDIPGHP